MAQCGGWHAAPPTLEMLLHAIHLLAALVAFLGVERERGDGVGVEQPHADGLAGFFAIAIVAIFDPADGGVDLGDEFALPAAGAQLWRRSPLPCGAIRRGRVKGRTQLLSPFPRQKKRAGGFRPGALRCGHNKCRAGARCRQNR